MIDVYIIVFYGGASYEVRGVSTFDEACDKLATDSGMAREYFDAEVLPQIDPDASYAATQAS